MVFFPDLETGIILATLRIEGNTPNLKHALKRIDNLGAITIAPAFTLETSSLLRHNFCHSLAV